MGLGDKISHLQDNIQFTPKSEIVIDPERKRTKNIIYINSEERTSAITSKQYEALNGPLRVLIWTLVFAVFAVQVLNAAEDIPAYACFQCRSLKNRDWRNDVLGNCSGTIDDCGECMKRHYGAPGEICKPRADEVQFSNSDVVFFPNGDAVLNCKLSEPGDCVWEKDGIQFPIAGRLEYINTNRSGINTKECGIFLRSMEVSDLGYYRCTSGKSKQGSSGNTISAAHIIIREETTVVVEKDNPIAHVQLGDTVIIPCHFQNPVQCDWRRGEDHRILEISRRYSYLNVDGNIEKTDCSVQIRELAAIDLKLWSCKGHLRNSHNEVASTSVTLKLVKPPSFVQRPKSMSAAIGDRVVQHCMFNSEVQCTWMHNDSDVPIAGRYRFIEGNFSKVQTRRNCGIEILEFRQEDAGGWSCSYNGFKTGVPYFAWLSVTMDNSSMFSTTLPMQKVSGTTAYTYQGQHERTTKDNTKESLIHVFIGVGVAIGVAVGIIGVFVGIVIYHMKRQKRQMYEVEAISNVSLLGIQRKTEDIV